MAKLAGKQQEVEIRKDHGQEAEHSFIKIMPGHSQRVPGASSIFALLVVRINSRL